MNTNWNISGLIFEGIAGTGKSTTLESLLKSEQWSNKIYKSEIILSEHHTQRVLEKKENTVGLVKEDNIKHLSGILERLEMLEKNAKNMPRSKNRRLNHKIPFILERFHLTHCYHYEHISREDLKSIDERLKSLNTKICLFTIDNEDIENRIINDYKKQGRRKYLKRFGDNKYEIIEHFVEKQQQLIEISKKSRIPIKIINTSNSTTEEIVNKIINFRGIL